jgi:hypothetical protein
MQSAVRHVFTYLAVAMASAAAAQINKPEAVPATRPALQQPTDRKVPLLTAPLTLAQFQGMTPSAAIAAQLTHISGFTQESPTNGGKPSERTEAWLGHTRTALYVVIAAYDHHPADIRRHLSRRENILTDDNVGVLLDTFQDHRRGTLFQVNALGVQADAAWSDDSGPDYSYDQVWNSSARVTEQGWLALMEIPFTSLRFRAGVQGWGLVLLRSLPRTSETDSWPAISANITGTLSQEGTLEGIEGITGSHSLQLNPYGLLQNEHTLDTRNPLQPAFSTRRLEGTAGGEAKAIVKDSIVIDATFNPDFSQVESDQPQFTVNQRYPVYFAELRPFFLENANYFATPIDLVYTRNIVHPEFGVRVTGKLGRTNLGLLAIDDREPGEGLAADDPLFGKRAHYTIARVSEDVGKESSVGLIYTDEELAGSYNRVGGLDFNAHLGPAYTLAGEAVVSATQPSLPGAPLPYSAGPAEKLEFSRQSHKSGFIQTTGFRQNESHGHLKWYPRNSPVQQVGLEESGQFAFDRAGNRLYHYNTFDPFVTMARNTVVAVLVGENSDTLSSASYPQLAQPRNLTENFVGAVVRSAPIPQLSFNVVTTYGGNPNYNPAGTQAPSLLHQNFVQALLTLQPVGSLTIDNTYLLDRNFAAAGGAFVFENQTLRTKINYQFTRALSARVITEYDSLFANPAQTSLYRTKEVATQALLTWLPHPGTAIYLGYNNDLQNLNHQVCTQLPGSGQCDPTQPVLPRATNYLNDGRQFFVKFSYLLRF